MDYRHYFIIFLSFSIFLDLVVDEISHLENQHLTFRGNSIATKAMECYIKLVGKPYLISTLQTVIVDIIGASDLDLEIDPIKVSSAEILSLNRQNLLNVVRQIWNRIVKSHAYFPVQLQRCFYKIRGYLKEVGNPDLGDKLISSCIFLRFLCPAILTPSLFNLSDEFPSEKANRNLTLVAKTLMTLANFQRYESKENSMEFLNPFLAEETETMKTFLRQISSPLSEDCWIPSLSFPVEKSDLGRYLSSLHTILFENVSKLPLDNANAVKLRKLLDDISNILKRPTIPQLELISQPTMETLKLKQDHKNSSSSGASNSENNHHPVVQTKSSRLGITIPWLGTLPKTKNKNQHHSHPAPHHEQKSTLVVSSKTSSSSSSSSSNNTNTASATLTPSHLKSPMHGLGPSEVISLSPSDTSDSSQSLTPSPAGPMSTQRNWGGGATSTTSSSGSEILGAPSSTGRHLHDSYHHHHSKYRSASSKKIFTSSMSLDETDSSDDSTYSSQYQSDANSTPRTGTSHTLPRHLPTTRSSMMSTSVVTNQGSGVGANSCSVVKVKSMSDYETEILQMRSEMEQLQSKLVEAERQIQFNHVSNNHHQRNNEVEAKEVVDKLKREEDKLRREQLEMTSEDPIADKERMILMQQKKIAALDSANKRLLEELTRMTQMTSAASTKVSVITNPSTSTGLNNVTSINTSSNTVTTGAVPLVPVPQSQHDRRTSSSSTSSNKSITVITNGEASTVTSTTSPSTASTTATAPTPNNHAKSNSLTQETPKTVDELLDSLHSTSI